MKYISAWMLRTVIRIFESSKHNIITYPLSKSILKTLILLPGLPSQSSFGYVGFQCSLQSLESLFENHNSSRCYWSTIWIISFEASLESIKVHAHKS